MTRSVACVILAVLALVGMSGCGSDPSAPAVGQGWTLFELELLGVRNDPVVGAVGPEVLVAGGNEFMCPPTADCAWPDEAPLSDAAIFDTETFEWRQAATAPHGIDQAEAVTIGSSVFAITQCEKRPSCPRGRTMVRYDFDDDDWTSLRAVPGSGYHNLLSVGGELVAVSASDELPESDYRYKEESDSWVALDPSPMPPSYDRFGVDVDGSLVVYGSPIDDDSGRKIATRYDLAEDRWMALAQAPSRGWQVFDVDDTVVLNPHFGAEPGGVHDVSSDTWSPLPSTPSSERWRGDIAGVIGDGVASYEYPNGWMLDVRSDSWIEVGPSGGVTSGASVTAVGDSLFVVGGHGWTDDDELVHGGGALWMPPDR